MFSVACHGEERAPSVLVTGTLRLPLSLIKPVPSGKSAGVLPWGGLRKGHLGQIPPGGSPDGKESFCQADCVDDI